MSDGFCSCLWHEAVTTKVECVSQSDGRPISVATKNGLRSTLGDPFGPPVGVVRGWWEAHWREMFGRFGECRSSCDGASASLRQSLAAGVGHEPEPLALVWGANIGR